MQTIKGIKETQSWISEGSAWTQLNYHPSTDMVQAFQELQTKIAQINEWPVEVKKPLILDFSNGGGSGLASFYIYRPKGFDQLKIIEFYKDIVKPRLIQIAGVRALMSPSHKAQEQFTLYYDHSKMSDFGIELDELISALSDIKSQTGGKVDVGSKSFSVAFDGKNNLAEVLDTPIKSTDGFSIKISDVARVVNEASNDWGAAYFNNYRAMFLYAEPTTDANYLKTVEEIKLAIHEINQNYNEFKVGIGFDNSEDIKLSIKEVLLSILTGVLLVGGVLFFYIRNISKVIIVFFSIPLSLVFISLAFLLFERSLNLISLAGVALSLGMVIDTSLVFIENLDRKLKLNLKLEESIKQSLAETRSAILASTLTSIVVFLPMLFINSTEAQLFTDISVALIASLSSAVIITMFIVPALAYLILKNQVAANIETKVENSRNTLVTFISERKKATSMMIIVLPSLLVVLNYLLFPKFDFLPSPKASTVSVLFVAEDSYTYEYIDETIAKFALTKLSNFDLLYDRYDLRCNDKNCFLNIYTQENKRSQLISKLEAEFINKLEGVFVRVSQDSLLSYQLPDSRAGYIDLKGYGEKQQIKITEELIDKLSSVFLEAYIYADSALTKDEKQINIQLDLEKLAAMKIPENMLKHQLVTMTYGKYLGENSFNGKTIPFFIKEEHSKELSELLQSEINIAGYSNIKIGELVDIDFGVAESSLTRVNGERSATVFIEAPDNVPANEFFKQVKTEIAQFKIDSAYHQLGYTFRGTPNNLNDFFKTISIMAVFAIFVVALIVWFTLNSLKLSVIALFSIPLSILGASLVLNLYLKFNQLNLDIISSLGFVLLIGLVINNAILLLSRFNIHLKFTDVPEALSISINERKRAIYMSTVTSIVGMLPLLISMSSSSLMYKGLAIIVVSGMAINLLLVIPFIISTVLMANVKRIQV